MNRTLEAMAQALFRSWFVDFDPVSAKTAQPQPLGMDATTVRAFASDFTDSELGPIPKGWSIRLVRDEYRLVMGEWAGIAISIRGEQISGFGSLLPGSSALLLPASRNVTTRW
jgi:hypothetical protein